MLLEFGEIYFEDFSAIYYPMAPSEAESVEMFVITMYDNYIHVYHFRL